MPDASRKANAEAERRIRAEPEVTHRAYTIVPRDKEDDYWVHLGDVTTHRDGGGFTLRLHAIPPDGKIICRRHYPQAENGR